MKLRETKDFKYAKERLEEFLNFSILGRLRGEDSTTYFREFTQRGEKDVLRQMGRSMFVLDILDKIEAMADIEGTPETIYELNGLSNMLFRIESRATQCDEVAKEAYQYVVDNDENFRKKYNDAPISVEGLKVIYPKFRELNKASIAREVAAKTNTINEFDKYLRALIIARTEKNSDAYENIIKTVEWVNKTGDFKKGAGLNPYQKYAAKLLAIKNSINAYIEHKAEHGVNKDIGSKLAIVEALNFEVSERLIEIKNKTAAFTINGKPVDLEKIPIDSYQEESEARRANPQGSNQIPKDISDEESLTDDCMKRIITKAIEKKYSDTQISKLEKMRPVVFGNSIPQPEKTTSGTFEGFIKKLEDAKTLRNSDAYDDLIKMVKFANSQEKWEKGKDLTEEQANVMLLRGIKSAINKYIKHKGEKGVRQNAYKKLAAVEELNAEITKRLSAIKFDPFEYGNETITQDMLVLTYENEQQMYEKGAFRREGMKNPDPIKKETLEKHIEKLQSKGFYKNATADELSNADKCMCRIILSAMGNKDVKDKDVAELVDMRKEFWANPAKDIEKIRVEEPENPGRRLQ